MTANLVGMIVKRRSNDMRELIGQGVANFVAGWLGSMGGDPLVGQSMINVLGGSSGRLSAFISSILLLITMLFAHPVVERIPLGGLAGIMFGVVVHTWHLRTFDYFVNRRLPYIDLVVILAVTLVTIFIDVAVGIFVGVCISALAYAWHSTTELQASVSVTHSDLIDAPVAKLDILGPMFFGSGRVLHNRILELELAEHADFEHIIIDLTHAGFHDATALTTLEEVGVQFLRTQQFLHVKDIRAAAERIVQQGQSLMPTVMDDSPAGVGLWRVDVAQRHSVCAASGHAILPGDLRMGCTIHDPELKINVYVWVHVDDAETRHQLRHERKHAKSTFARICPCGPGEESTELSYGSKSANSSRGSSDSSISSHTFSTRYSVDEDDEESSSKHLAHLTEHTIAAPLDTWMDSVPHPSEFDGFIHLPKPERKRFLRVVFGARSGGSNTDSWKDWIRYALRVVVFRCTGPPTRETAPLMVAPEKPRFGGDSSEYGGSTSTLSSGVDAKVSSKTARKNSSSSSYSSEDSSSYDS